MKSETKTKIFIVTIIMIVCILFCSILFLFQKNPKPIEKEPLSLSTTPVNEYSTFFAIVNDLNQYFRYIKEQNKDAVYSLLFESFILENDITTTNIFSKIKLENEDQIVQAQNIYYQEINGNYLYLVEGNLLVNSFEENTVINENFQIFILMDYENSTYAIYPIEENEEIKSPLTENKISILNNDYNRMLTTGVISKDYICNLYYADYLEKISTNRAESYEVLTDKFQKDYSLNEYQNYLNRNINKISSEIKECTVSEEEEKRIYRIIDTNENEFTLIENSIMNYQVEFSLNTN